ncbi:hypothetical protein EHR05_07235 [Leptospira licerasiae]|nr:hypothetical protein EHR05_07235 [Leptospira licerasiae]
MKVHGKLGSGVQSSETDSCFLLLTSVFFSFGVSVMSLPVHSRSEKSIFLTGLLSDIQPNWKISKVTHTQNRNRL